jgi:hypothetical protein
MEIGRIRIVHWFADRRRKSLIHDRTGASRCVTPQEMLLHLPSIKKHICDAIDREGCYAPRL